MAVATQAPLYERAAIQLVRLAELAGRPRIVIVNDDLAALDRTTGSRQRSHEVVERLVDDGRLRRVKRGIYVLVGSDGVIRAGLLDIVAATTPKPYLVTAGRALEVHDLTDQHFHRVIVLVTTQLRPWSWRGDEVRFARVQRSRLRTKPPRTRKTRARVASPELAILDSLAHPQWGVTLSQVVQAIDIAVSRDVASVDRLAMACADYGGPASARRLGFIVSRIVGFEAARPFLPLIGRGKATTLLAQGRSPGGHTDSTWHVRENVTVEQLLQHRYVM
jgi:predicted transcriptional regulator of viral defense system